MGITGNQCLLCKSGKDNRGKKEVYFNSFDLISQNGNGFYNNTICIEVKGVNKLFLSLCTQQFFSCLLIFHKRTSDFHV